MSIRYTKRLASTLRYEKEKVELLHIAAMKRLQPTFDSVIDEAIALADGEFARVNALSTDGAEQLSYRGAWGENGAPYYRDMENVKEVVINMLVVSLYHLFEQQLDALCRRLSPNGMPATGPTPSLRAMVGSLQACGLNVSAFSC